MYIPVKWIGVSIIINEIDHVLFRQQHVLCTAVVHLQVDYFVQSCCML